MTIYIFIDESGTLPDPKDHQVVLAAVASENSSILNRFQGKSKREIKFYSAGDKTRIKYLNRLSKEDVSIFTLAVNKSSQKIADSPQNFAVLSWFLLLDCLAYFRSQTTKIIFDRHFHRNLDEESFFNTLRKISNLNLDAKSEDSAKNSGIMAADMVAGAFLYSRSGKNDLFYKLIKDKVISEKIINWKEAKRKFLEELKNLA